MDEDWLEVAGEDFNVEDIMRQIRERIARRSGAAQPEGVEKPEAVAEGLWKEMMGGAVEEQSTRRIPIRQPDCDIVPRYYVIDWRIPILGPIHAVVRRIINAEIRRYLFPSLEKQSRFNRQVLRVLTSLAQENARLRQDLQELVGEQK